MCILGPSTIHWMIIGYRSPGFLQVSLCICAQIPHNFSPSLLLWPHPGGVSDRWCIWQPPSLTSCCSCSWCAALPFQERAGESFTTSNLTLVGWQTHRYRTPVNPHPFVYKLCRTKYSVWEIFLVTLTGSIAAHSGTGLGLPLKLRFYLICSQTYRIVRVWWSKKNTFLLCLLILRLKCVFVSFFNVLWLISLCFYDILDFVLSNWLIGGVIVTILECYGN